MDYKDENVWLMHGDCLERMEEIESGSVDMVLTDPPYGTTACKWDSIIPLEPMWEQLKRIIKPNGAIVMTSSQPFTSALISSNMSGFCYNWTWNKRKAGNIFLAKVQPMKVHEDVCVFSLTGKMPNFYPIKTLRDKIKKSRNYGTGQAMGGTGEREEAVYTYTHKNPISIIDISNARQKGKLHPTQKPVALMEYLIKTYTNEGETVLDFTFGSGTTGVAAKSLNRKFIGIEMDDNYFEIAKDRILND
jgi:site-specific DNA-methyltransferase (adenine-specific)